MFKDLTIEQKSDLVRERFEAFKRSHDRTRHERSEPDRKIDISRDNRDGPSRRR